VRISIPISLFTGIFLSAAVSDGVGWLGAGSLQDQMKQTTILITIVWSELLLFTIFAHVPARGSRLSLALPIGSRRLWRVRIGAILFAGLLPLAVITALTTLHPWIFPGPGGFDARFVGLGARIGAGYILAILLFQIPAPELYRIRTNRGYLTYVVIVAIAMGAALILLPYRPFFLFLILLAALIIGLWIYSRLPDGFLTAPRGPELSVTGSGTDPGTTKPVSSSRRGHRFLAWTIWRIVMNHPLTWVAIPFLLFWGDRLIFAYREGWDLIPYYVLLLLYPGLLIFFAVLRMFLIDPLPISRISIFPHIYLPLVAAFAAGLAIGWIDYELRGPHGGMIHYHGDRIQVPEDAWELTTEGRAPLIVAPWGESYRPMAYPLYRGSRFVVYNPYERAESSSTRFVDYQLARAVEAIHGSAYLPTEGAAAVSDRRPAQDRDDRCCLPLQGTAGAGSPRRNRAMATTAMLFILLSSGLYAFGLQQFRARGPRHLSPWFLQGLIGPLALAACMVLVGNATGFTSFQAVGAFPMVLIRKFGEAIPGPTAVIWVLTGFAFILGYWLMQARFAGIEAPVGQQERDLSKEY
jgi:hypothetical protein